MFTGEPVRKNKDAGQTQQTNKNGKIRTQKQKEKACKKAHSDKVGTILDCAKEIRKGKKSTPWKTY